MLLSTNLLCQYNIASTCANYTGDTYILAYVNDEYVTYSDDSCGYGSELSVLVQPSDSIEITEGCYQDESCSATVVLTSSSILFACEHYTATNTSSGTTNFSECNYTYSGVYPLIITGWFLLYSISKPHLIFMYYKYSIDLF